MNYMTSVNKGSFCVVQYLGGGLAGLQGVFYIGTNCLHKRKVIYGLSPDHHIQNEKKDGDITNSNFTIIFYESKFVILILGFKRSDV